LRLGTETNRLLVDVESDIVDSSHTVLLTWFLSQPATAGLIQHFCSTIGRTSPSIHSNNRQNEAFADSGRRQYSFFVRVEYSGRVKALHRSERAGEWPSHRPARGRKRITNRARPGVACGLTGRFQDKDGKP